MAWINTISCLTAAWLLVCGGRAVLELSRGKRDSILFLVLIHVLFCGAPLLLDVTVGQPTWRTFSGFYLASRDPATMLIYFAYISTVPVMLYSFGRTSRSMSRPVQQTDTRARYVSGRRARRFNLLLWAALSAPVFAVMWSPQLSLYRSYGAVATEAVADVDQYAFFVSALCLVAIVSTIGIVITAPSLSKRLFLMLAPWLIAACWLFGKRTIIALLVLGLVYAWWYRGLLSGRRLVIALAAGAVVVALGSYGYQRIVRQMNANEFDAYYDNVRIDFGRDAGIQQTIHAELGDESDSILDYRGQSLVFTLTMFVPRPMWSAKPWPYAVYRTAKALNLHSATSLGWGVTTSWLDEAIANFSWYGLLIGPLSLAMLCRIGDRTADPFTQYVTVCIGTLLMSVQLVAFAPLVIIWMMLCIWQHYLKHWGLTRRRFQVASPSLSMVKTW